MFLQSPKTCWLLSESPSLAEDFEIYNDLTMYGDNGRTKMFYSWVEEEKRAAA